MSLPGLPPHPRPRALENQNRTSPARSGSSPSYDKLVHSETRITLRLGNMPGLRAWRFIPCPVSQTKDLERAVGHRSGGSAQTGTFVQPPPEREEPFSLGERLLNSSMECCCMSQNSVIGVFARRIRVNLSLLMGLLRSFPSTPLRDGESWTLNSDQSAKSNRSVARNDIGHTLYVAHLCETQRCIDRLTAEEARRGTDN